MNFYEEALLRIKRLENSVSDTAALKQVLAWCQKKQIWYRDLEKSLVKNKARMPVVESEVTLRADMETALEALESGEVSRGLAQLLKVTNANPIKISKYQRPKCDTFIDYEAIKLARLKPRNPNTIRIA